MSFPTAFTGHVLPRHYRQFEDGVATAPLAPATQGSIRYNDTQKTFQVSIDGAAYVNLAFAADAGFIGGNSGSVIVAAASTVYALANGHDVEGNSQVLASRPGLLSNLFVQAGFNTMDDVTVFTLRRNGVDTAVTLSIPAGSTAQFSDVANTGSVLAGDLISLEIDGTASAVGNLRGVAYGFQLATA